MTTNKEIFNSFLRNPFKQKLLKCSTILDIKGVSNFVNRYSKLAKINGFSKHKLMKNEGSLCFLLRQVLELQKPSILGDIRKNKEKLSEELSQYEEKDISNDPELSQQKEELGHYEGLLGEVENINLLFKSHVKDLKEDTNMESFHFAGKFKNYFLYIDSEKFDYAFIRFERNENFEVYVSIYALNYNLLENLRCWMRFFFGIYSSDYVKVNSLNDVRSLYLYAFFNDIQENTDIIRYGYFIKNIKNSIICYTENRPTLGSNNYKECIYYLGLALEELLEKVYESLFDEPTPEISINDLICLIHRKCKLLLNDPNILVNKYIRKKLDGKENVGIAEYDYESDFIKKENLSLKNGSIFGSNLDKALVISRDIRNKVSHRNKIPINRIDVLEMVIGVGMLFYWWKKIFNTYFKYPKNKDLTDLDKKDIYTKKNNKPTKEVDDDR